MRLMNIRRRFLFPAVLALLTLFQACSGSPDTATTSTTTFPLASPARLANVDASTLLVSDYTGQALHLLDKLTLEPIRSIRIKGQPTGVVFHAGLYYVGNKSTRSVDVLDADGRFLSHLGRQAGLFQQVNDLALDAVAAALYVVDTRAAVIRKFDLNSPDSSPLTLGAGVLVRPTALFLDPESGRLYVSDFGDSAGGILPRIQVLDADDGALLDAIVASPGGMMGTQSFSTPQGLCVDADGLLYTVDSLSGEVLIFDLKTGSLVKSLGSSGTAPGELFYPLDVFVEAGSKDVYVADNRNGRITLFPEGGQLP